MDVRNCRGCGRLYNYVGGGYTLCPVCMEELDKKFTVVKNYIRDNPRATIQQIAEDNDVTIPQIQRWVREERLIFSDDSPIGIDCECCGAMIKSGRFCDKCKDSMQKNLSSAYKRSEPENRMEKSSRDSARMRFLDK